MGTSEGKVEGKVVGDLVGALVGNFVGNSVGAEVGGSVGDKDPAEKQLSVSQFAAAQTPEICTRVGSGVASN